MSTTTETEHARLAEQLVAEAHRHGGLIPLDIEGFWQDNAQACKDPFAKDCPQVPCGIRMHSDEAWAPELGLKQDHYRYLHDAAFRCQINRRYNDKAQAIVGQRLLREIPPDPQAVYPRVAALHDIFEARQQWYLQSYWIHPAADNEDELRALLDRVERRLENLRHFILPDNWDAEKTRLTRRGVRPPLYRDQRGPVTFATSVFGTENLLFLILDNPDLARRFSDLIRRAMLERASILDQEAGWTPDGDWGRGFSFRDDNCALLTPAMYEMFGLPILQAVFDRYASQPGDRRYQHSDSPMAHLLPLLGTLNLTAVNFGPTVLVEHIRRHLPHTVTHGCLAPFTFSRNDEVGMVKEFLRDYTQAQSQRGLLFATAGSINAGSRLTGLRLIMAAIQRYGRYDLA